MLHADGATRDGAIAAGAASEAPDATITLGMEGAPPAVSAEFVLENSTSLAYTSPVFSSDGTVLVVETSSRVLDLGSILAHWAGSATIAAALLLVLTGALLAWRARRRPQAPGRAYCARCNYELEGTPATTACPECGCARGRIMGKSMSRRIGPRLLIAALVLAGCLAPAWWFRVQASGAGRGAHVPIEWLTPAAHRLGLMRRVWAGGWVMSLHGIDATSGQQRWRIEREGSFLLARLRAWPDAPNASATGTVLAGLGEREIGRVRVEDGAVIGRATLPAPAQRAAWGEGDWVLQAGAPRSDGSGAVLVAAAGDQPISHLLAWDGKHDGSLRALHAWQNERAFGDGEQAWWAQPQVVSVRDGRVLGLPEQIAIRRVRQHTGAVVLRLEREDAPGSGTTRVTPLDAMGELLAAGDGSLVAIAHPSMALVATPAPDAVGLRSFVRADGGELGLLNIDATGRWLLMRAVLPAHEEAWVVDATSGAIAARLASPMGQRVERGALAPGATRAAIVTFDARFNQRLMLFSIRHDGAAPLTR